MNPKVIPINLRSSRRRSEHDLKRFKDGNSFERFTREELKAWEKISPKSKISLWLPIALALSLHAALSLGLQSLKAPLEIDQEKGGGGTARVTLLDGSNSGSSEDSIPEPQPFPNKPVDAPIITGPSTSAANPQVPANSKSEAARTSAKIRPQIASPSLEGQVRVPAQAMPLHNEKAESDKVKEQETPVGVSSKNEKAATGPGVGFSQQLEDLLPNSDSQYVATQRRIGSVYGKGAVGGDLAPESDSPTGFKPPDSGEVKVTRYDYAAYFLSLDRRFTEAWGGTRTLPRGSSFVGTVGEFIEYDIVINRDGSLSKIINVSQRTQTGRDFSAVDHLVEDVFSNVFPLNPVPSRIREDPLILRKRIQFTGYRLFFY